MFQDFFGLELVVGVHVGEQERDRDGAEPLLFGAPCCVFDRLGVQRLFLRARVVEATPDFDDVGTGNEWGRLAKVDVVQARPVAAGDVVDVAGAFGRQQQHALAASLEKRVQPLGGAVDREAAIRGLGLDRGQRAQHALGQVSRCGRGLPGGVAAGVLVVGDEIREGPADVHRHAEPAHAASTTIS